MSPVFTHAFTVSLLSACLPPPDGVQNGEDAGLADGAADLDPNPSDTGSERTAQAHAPAARDSGGLPDASVDAAAPRDAGMRTDAGVVVTGPQTIPARYFGAPLRIVENVDKIRNQGGLICATRSRQRRTVEYQGRLMQVSPAEVAVSIGTRLTPAPDPAAVCRDESFRLECSSVKCPSTISQLFGPGPYDQHVHSTTLMGGSFVFGSASTLSSGFWRGVDQGCVLDMAEPSSPDGLRTNGLRVGRILRVEEQALRIEDRRLRILFSAGPCGAAGFSSDIAMLANNWVLLEDGGRTNDKTGVLLEYEIRLAP
jgi:hypothetical protein